MRSMSWGNVPAERRASSGPIGKPWQRITPGRGSSRPAGTARWRASVRPSDVKRAVHTGRPSGTRAAVSASLARVGQR